MLSSSLITCRFRRRPKVCERVIGNLQIIRRVKGAIAIYGHVRYRPAVVYYKLLAKKNKLAILERDTRRRSLVLGNIGNKKRKWRLNEGEKKFHFLFFPSRFR